MLSPKLNLFLCFVCLAFIAVGCSQKIETDEIAVPDEAFIQASEASSGKSKSPLTIPPPDPINSQKTEPPLQGGPRLQEQDKKRGEFKLTNNRAEAAIANFYRRKKTVFYDVIRSLGKAEVVEKWSEPNSNSNFADIDYRVFRWTTSEGSKLTVTFSGHAYCTCEKCRKRWSDYYRPRREYAIQMVGEPFQGTYLRHEWVKNRN